MRPPQGWEWLIILAVVLLLFGARRLPELARSVGRSMKIFKSEVREGKAEEPGTDGTDHTDGPAAPVQRGADGAPDDDGGARR